MFRTFKGRPTKEGRQRTFFYYDNESEKPDEGSTEEKAPLYGRSYSTPLREGASRRE